MFLATKLPKYYVIVCLFFISSCPSCLASGKHRTESHATKWRKTKTEVTKICDEPGIKFHNFKKLYLLVFHVRLYVFSALSDFEKNCRITGYDDNARHQKSENHEKFLGRCVISPGTENWNLCLRFFVLFCLQSCVWPT